MTSVYSTQAKVDILASYIAGKTFYAHLVTAVPAISVSTVSGLSLVAGGNYAPKPVSFATPSVDGTGARAMLQGTDQFIEWLGLIATSTATVGVALCQQLGAAPASTDRVVGFIRNTAIVTIANCTTAANSSVITTTNSFTGLVRGSVVSGTGIPVGSRILSILSNTQMAIDQEATAAGTIGISIASPAIAPIKQSAGDDTQVLVSDRGLIRFD